MMLIYRNLSDHRTCVATGRGLAIWLLSFATLVNAQTGTTPDEGVRFNPPSATLLKNGFVVRDHQREMFRGDVLVRSGKIVGVGVDVSRPADAQVIDCAGKYVYPALIDAFVEMESTPISVPADHWNAQIVPNRRMDLQISRDTKRLAQFRKAGFGIVLAVPADRIFKGSSCVLTTSDAAIETTLLRPAVFQHVRLLPSRGAQRGGYPNSPMGAVALARQTMLDAMWYQQATQAFHADPSLPQPDRNEALESLERASRGQQPVMLDGPNELFALRADRFAREFALKAIIRGSGREYRQIDAIAATGRTIVVPVNFPKPPEVGSSESIAETSLQTLMHWELAPENPARLEKAGVHFVLSTDGLSEPTELLAQVRKAIDRGLNRSTALAALTTRPAELLGVSELTGSLDVGKLANLLVTNGPLWDRSTKIVETWVQGQREQYDQNPNSIDLNGRWSLTLNGPSGFPAALEMSLETMQDKPAGRIAQEGKLDDEAKAPEKKQTDSTASQTDKKSASAQLKQLGARGERIAAYFHAEVLGIEKLSGPAHISATAISTGESVQLSGSILWPNGRTSSLHGLLAGKALAQPSHESNKDAKQDARAENLPEQETGKDQSASDASSNVVISRLNYPFGDFGLHKRPEQPRRLMIRGATIWTCGPQGKLPSADMIIHEGRIEAIGPNLQVPEGATIVDGSNMHVAPGIIDCHSHMATDGGVNESGQAVTAEVRIGDFIDSNDISIYRQLAGGVTTANVLHGSANPIGGQNQVIKLRWGAVDEDLKMVEAPAGIKFALGENVKQSNWTERTSVRYPQTRMGVEQIIRDRFEAAKLYSRKRSEWANSPRGLPPRRDLELDALAEVLDGKRWIHCHSYRQDEILAFLKTLDDFSVRVGTLQHILEGYKVADAMAKHGATGSSFSDWWAYKFEVLDAIPFNGALMHRAGVIVSFNSDDRELARHLNHEAAKAIKYGGVAPEEALKFVTLNPAKQLRIDQWVGSLEKGKQADFVVWSGSPLSTLSRCEQTWIDGRKYFDRQDDILNRKQSDELRLHLVSKILKSGEKMASDSSDSNDPSLWWVRYDEFCHQHDHDHDEQTHEGHALDASSQEHR